MNMLGSCGASESVRRVDAGCLQETDSAELFQASRPSEVTCPFRLTWKVTFAPVCISLCSFSPHIECPQVAWTLSQEEPRCRCVGARRQRVDSGCWPAPRVTLTGDRRRLSSLSGSVILVPTPKEASEPRNGATTSPETRTWTRLAVFLSAVEVGFQHIVLDVNNIPSYSGRSWSSLHLWSVHHVTVISTSHYKTVTTTVIYISKHAGSNELCLQCCLSPL